MKLLPRILLIFALLAPAPLLAWGATDPTTRQFCGCHKRYDISQSKVAFKGRYTHFQEIIVKEEGVRHSKVDLHFQIEDVYAGIPMGQQTMVIRTDTSSCGYGALMMPQSGPPIFGGTFIVFADSGFVTICNSVIADETWALKNENPFIKHQPYRPVPRDYRPKRKPYAME